MWTSDVFGVINRGQQIKPTKSYLYCNMLFN